MDFKVAVRDCIAEVTKTGDFDVCVSALSKLMLQFGPASFFEGLEATIESETGVIQSTACSYALRLRPDTPLADKASKFLLKNLERGSFEERLSTVFWMFWGKITKEVHVPVMRSIWRRIPKDDNRRLWAIGAAYQGAAPDGPHADIRSTAMTELRNSLRCNDPYSVVLAALAFSTERLHEQECLRRMIEACECDDQELRPVFVSMLVKICGARREVIDYLLSLICGECETPLKIAAVIALARSPDSNPEVDRALLEAMKCEEWNVLTQATAALSVRNNGLPRKAAYVLVSWLDHVDPSIRGTAVRLLWDAGAETVVRVFESLRERLDNEEDQEIALAVSVAIGLGGLDVLPKLVKGLERCPVQSVAYYQSSLYGIGMKHPNEIAKLLGSQNEKVRRTVALVFTSMGSDAAAAADTIAKLLKSKDEGVVRDALVAIRSLGPSGLPAIKLLGRLLDHENESFRVWSKDAILGIGPVAIPELDAMRKRASKRMNTTLVEILKHLAKMVVSTPTVTTSVDGVNDETELSRFVAIGTLLAESGAMSFLKLEKALELRNDELSLSASTIRRTIESLEQKWSQSTGKEIILVDRTANAKGGITKIGKQYLRRSQGYLAQIHEARQPRE